MSPSESKQDKKVKKSDRQKEMSQSYADNDSCLYSRESYFEDGYPLPHKLTKQPLGDNFTQLLT